MLIENTEQVEDFSARHAVGIERGILGAKPELLNLDRISDRILSVDVRWPGFDKEGKENYTETSHYLIHIESGKPLIRAAASRTNN
jgi:hypothetical protein